MPLFIVSWMDKPGHLPVRMASRQAHLDYVKETGVVRLGGPFLALDPYRTAGLFETSQVKPWRITVGAIA